MKKRNLHKILMMCGALVMAASCGMTAPTGDKVVLHTPAKEVTFAVQIVETPEDVARGLSGVERLAKDQGMLFRFDGSDIRYFWMKEMNIPLDIIFVDRDGYVVHVLPDLQPCPEDLAECPSFSSLQPAKYVLEINAGLAKEFGIAPMTRMDIIEVTK